MGFPLVTIGVASYNNATYLKETLDSIRLQSYHNIELIIVDDASTDGSIDIILSWLDEYPEVNAKLIRYSTNMGVCRVCNEIVTNANGEFISIIGSDDTYCSDKLAVQVPLLINSSQEVGVITSAIEFMDENGRTIPQPDDFAFPHPENVFLILLNSCIIAAMSVLVRRSCFDEVGLYDESLPFEDWDMWLRLSKKYKFLYSPHVSARYRRHANSVFTTRRRQMEEGSLILLNKQRGICPEADAIIIAQTRLRSELLYQIGSEQARHWLHVRWKDDQEKSSWLLYAFATLKIPGNWVAKLQRCLGR